MGSTSIRKIEICKNIGFCSGVQRVIDLANDFLGVGDERLYVTGDIVHNSGVMESLLQKGLRKMIPQDLPEHETVLLQAHGIDPSLERELQKRGNKIIDGVCPILKQNFEVFKRINDQGFQFLLLADTAHPEAMAIKGLLSKVNVFADVEELQKLTIPKDPIALISQSTKSVSTFRKSAEVLLNALRPGQRLQIYFSICDWTIKREEEIREAAPKYECVVIVGGKNSSNTEKLFRIAKENTAQAFWIENLREAKEHFQEFEKYSALLIGSGTSTPVKDIEQIKELFL